MKKNLIPRLRKKADRLFQQVGLAKFKYSMVSSMPAEVIHHFFTKGACSALRYDWDNAIPLTHKEHCRLHVAQDPRMIVTIRENMEPGRYERLKKKRMTTIKVGVNYYRGIIEDLEEQLVILNN